MFSLYQLEKGQHMATHFPRKKKKQPFFFFVSFWFGFLPFATMQRKRHEPDEDDVPLAKMKASKHVKVRLGAPCVVLLLLRWLAFLFLNK